MFRLLASNRKPSPELIYSGLYDENTFHKAFVRDLEKCRSEVIIESPFITSSRSAILVPIMQRLIERGVRIIINTRDFNEHDFPYDTQARHAIDMFQSIGVCVLFTGAHHRKIAIIDQTILWEGSLNILSQNNSCEIMRRIDSKDLAKQMIHFIKINKFLEML